MRILSFDSRTVGSNTPGAKSCGLGQTMSGVIVAMRRTLLSCTSLARNGLIALGTVTATSMTPAHASDLSFATMIAAYLDLNHQEFAVLTTALALLGFSVVAAILLMRTRLRAAGTEARLRSEIVDLQVRADRLHALLFTEPQILISWAAGENRPQISGDISLLMGQGSQQHPPQRILAFGTWLPPEPALQMDHAVDALREAGEGRSGPNAPMAPSTTPMPPMRGRPRPAASRMRSLATSNCSTAAIAAKWTAA
jgi:hypothetical protein